MEKDRKKIEEIQFLLYCSVKYLGSQAFPGLDSTVLWYWLGPPAFTCTITLSRGQDERISSNLLSYLRIVVAV